MPKKTNLQKICEDFDCSRQYVGELVKSQIIPKPSKRGAYDYRKSVKAYVAHLKLKKGQGVDMEKRDLDLEERTEKIRGHKLKNDKIQKEKDDEDKRLLVDLKEVAETMDSLIVG